MSTLKCFNIGESLRSPAGISRFLFARLGGVFPPAGFIVLPGDFKDVAIGDISAVVEVFFGCFADRIFLLPNLLACSKQELGELACNGLEADRGETNRDDIPCCIFTEEFFASKAVFETFGDVLCFWSCGEFNHFWIKVCGAAVGFRFVTVSFVFESAGLVLWEEIG
jgi:hypothetical protein